MGEKPRMRALPPRLIDDQQVRLCDARSSFARNLIASAHVDDVYDEVGELATEVGGEVVTSALQQDEIRRVLSAERPDVVTLYFRRARVYSLNRIFNF